MIKNLDKEGLRTIALGYDLFFIDIWGVIHNGLKLNSSAIEVLEFLNHHKKEFVLLSNAPRQNLSVIKFLKNFELKNFHSNVFTVG